MYKIDLMEVEEILSTVNAFHGPLPENIEYSEYVYQSIVRFFVEKIVTAYECRWTIATNLHQPSINPKARAKLQEILSTHQRRENIGTLLTNIWSNAKEQAQIHLSQQPHQKRQ